MTGFWPESNRGPTDNYISIKCRALTNCAKVTDKSLKILLDLVHVHTFKTLYMYICFYMFELIELQAKLLDYFLGSNKSNINQYCLSNSTGVPVPRVLLG